MIYITGDTHGNLNDLFSRNLPSSETFSSDDYLIITGDFGFVEDTFEKRKALDILSAYFGKCKILFICGNHEDFPYLNSFRTDIWNGGKIHIIRDNIFHLMRGSIFNINGKKIFAMGGAYSHDGPYRQKWYPNQEMPSSFEIYKGLFTLNANDNKVDYIITHTMPGTFLGYINKCPYPEETRLLGFFDNVYRDVEFERWFIGHYHIDKRLLGGRLTLISDEVITIE